MAIESDAERLAANHGARYLADVLDTFAKEPPENDYQRGYQAALAHFASVACIAFPGFRMTPELGKLIRPVTYRVVNDLANPDRRITDEQDRAVSIVARGSLAA